MKIMDVREKLEEFGNLPLECDGFTRVFEYFLTNNDITHQCYGGRIYYGEKSMEPHYWIVSDKYVVDYAIEMWFGKSMPVPNGILNIEQIKCANGFTTITTKEKVKYRGIPTTFEMNISLFNILTRELK